MARVTHQPKDPVAKTVVLQDRSGYALAIVLAYTPQAGRVKGVKTPIRRWN